MKRLFTNFNYEVQLQSRRRTTLVSEKEINRNFEFIFFFMEKEKSILINQNEYSQEYLDHIESLGLNVPEFDSVDNDITFWWGALEDLDHERTLNSKITSTQIAQRLKMCLPNTEVIFSEKEFKKYIELNKGYEEFFIRLPFSVSAQGCFRYKPGSKTPKPVDFSKGLILEPYLNKIKDFGCYITVDGDFIKWQNFTHNSGRYIGGRLIKDELPFSNYKASMMLVLNEYMNLGIKKGIQIDSFLYESEGTRHIYPLCEVNYRKTMGLFLSSLISFSNEDRVSLIIDKKNSNWFGKGLSEIFQKIGNGLYSRTMRKGILLLSPANIDRLAFAIIDYNEEEEKIALDQLRQEFF